MTSVQIISPSDGSVIASRELATQQQIDKVLSNAHDGQSEWQALGIQQRKRLCQKAIDYFDQNREAISKSISEQMGRPIKFSQGEINGLIERASYMISIAETSLADIKVEENVEFNRFIRPTPLGTCLIIAPWNYPYLTAINGIIAALLAGNSVILKHSAQTLLCGETFEKAFQSADIPEGTFQVLHLDHHQTSELIQRPDIHFVSFTGSVSGGKAVETAAAGLFKPVALELGGKDAAYVREDADIEFAAENLADGAFFNSGQSCCGIERIYLHESVYKPFLEKMIKVTNELKLGSALDETTTLGPMVNAESADYARKQIDLAIKQGATAQIEESKFPLSKAGSCYLAPQILTDVNHSMDLMTEESFAPIVGLMKVKDDNEALQLINDSKYGLTASIWSKDEESMIALGDKIQVGTVFMNRCDYLDPALAWAGVKDSGRGVALSSLGFSQVTRPKSFHLRKSPC